MPKKKEIKLYSTAEIAEHIRNFGLDAQIFQAFDSTELEDDDLRAVWATVEEQIIVLARIMKEKTGDEFIY